MDQTHLEWSYEGAHDVNPKKSDVVIFTDGSYPDDGKKETKELNPPMIGAVMLSRLHLQPVQGMKIVPQELIDQWLPRKNQICMVELLAPIAALWTWRHYLREKFVLLLIDSEVVEAALIKGYSAREDVCELVGVFWDLALDLRVQIYIDRVPTDGNPADGPSRGRLFHADQGWVTEDLCWPKVMKRELGSQRI